MPWKDTQAMDQRIEFAMKALSHPNFGELCRHYGISRKTGYKWRERFVSHGLDGMSELSRRPHSHAQQLSEDIVCQMVRLKNAHPHWGPRKIRELYRRARRGAEPPSESSFKRVLDKAGLTEPRKRRLVKERGRLARGIKADAPNDIWSVDFKGWWHDNSGHRIEPLTVRDEHSRMILELRAVPDARTDTVRASFEQLFEKHGLPAAIRSDNGPPFASANGLLGLSQLSAWWLALGIDLERSRPGCPQDNGAHERMHRDISKELERSPQGWTQAALDTWREEFNHQRPHQNLGMKMPGEIYHNSTQRYEGLPQELSYEALGAAAVAQRKIGPRGQLCWEHQQIFISNALAGWNVALCPVQDQDGLLDLYFASLLLGQVEPATHSFLRAPRGPKEAGVIPSDA